MLSKIKTLFLAKRIVDPALREGMLAFSNNLPIQNNPYKSKNLEFEQLWELGWREAKNSRYKMEDLLSPKAEYSVYRVGFLITAIVTFIASWIYCIATYGYLFGVGLGWLPSIIVAALVGLLWPLIAVILMIGFLYLQKIGYILTP